MHSNDTTLLTKPERQLFHAWWHANRNQRHQCYRPGCQNASTHCHLLGQASILRNIVDEQNHLIELRWPFNLQPATFDRRGLPKSNVMGFQCFCNHCDSLIFEEIENFPIDFSLYRHQLLLTYRALLNELHQVVALLDSYTQALSSIQFSSTAKLYLRHKQKDFLLKERALQYQKLLFEEDIFNNSTSHHFAFIRHTLPSIPLAGAAFIVAETIMHDENISEFLATTPTLEKYKFQNTSSYVVLAPQADRLECLLGYSMGTTHIHTASIIELESMQRQSLVNFINDLTIRRFAAWCVSPALFERMKFYDLDQQILKWRTFYRDGKNSTISVPFNWLECFV